jgi:hypothetical protein
VVVNVHILCHQVGLAELCLWSGYCPILSFPRHTRRLAPPRPRLPPRNPVALCICILLTNHTVSGSAQCWVMRVRRGRRARSEQARSSSFQRELVSYHSFIIQSIEKVSRLWPRLCKRAGRTRSALAPPVHGHLPAVVVGVSRSPSCPRLLPPPATALLAKQAKWIPSGLRLACGRYNVISWPGVRLFISLVGDQRLTQCVISFPAMRSFSRWDVLQDGDRYFKF